MSTLTNLLETVDLRAVKLNFILSEPCNYFHVVQDCQKLKHFINSMSVEIVVTV